MTKLRERAFIRFLLFLFSLTVIFSCAAAPLREGSALFEKKLPPLSCREDGKSVPIESMKGSPFLLYVRAPWCPICEETDGFFRFPSISVDLTGDVSLVVISLLNGYSAGGTPVASPKPWSEDPQFTPYEGSWKRILLCTSPEEEFLDEASEERVPLLLAVNREGKVVARIPGTGPDLTSGVLSALRKLR
ncbi:MAG: hypothetical protein D6713_00760 [Deltaproteobacteria bacterium]|nr:MAG: hypothetical protein D6713_00760 [Deltaproteobacteria bacterium]